jgi:Polyketide cyclase / dehydrase and lipid transport
MARTYRSAIVNASIDRVWECVRDFNALPNWHPAIAKSEIEGGRASDSVGCIRSFYLQDGGHLREQLLALSDIDHSFSYSILDSPMPLTNYLATLRLTSVTATGTTFAEWWADFDVTSGPTEGMITSIGDGVFAVGFAALDKKLTR